MNRKLTPKGFAVVYSILGVATMFVLVPVFWMISTSLKAEDEVFRSPPQWVPTNLTFEAFVRIWTDYPMLQYIGNSMLVVIVATLISLIFSTLAGFGASRFKFPGKGAFLVFLLMTQMFPSIMLLIPFYKILSSYDLINTYTGLVLTYISFTIPFCSWMMMGYFNTIPKELDQAAAIDGCSRFRTFWQIILPLTIPGIASTAIYAFIIGWNEYMFALTLMSDENLKTLPVGIGQMIGMYRILWNDLMAASLISSVPLIIIFLFLQKYLINGLTAGAVK